MVFTYGLLVIIANALYLLFSILVGVGIYLLLKKNGLVRWKGLISTTAFLVVLLTPFYDLIIQMGIKTYYQNFKMNDTIYAYPEKDENGKIESLATYKADQNYNGIFYYKNSYKDFLDVFLKVNNFVEVKIILNYNLDTGKYIGKYGEKFMRINLKDKTYSVISKNDFKARYIVDATNLEPELFNIYQKKIFTFKDNRKDKVMATAWRIEFPADKNSFRSRYLLWKNANGVPIGLDFISNDKRISEEVLGFDYRINISKLRG